MFIFTVGFALNGENAETILKMVDETNNGSKAPADTEVTMVMKIHKGDSVKTREIKTWTKNNSDGEDWRVMKFLSPADVAGIGLLVMAENQMYLYLPEFRRIRRIASSTKKSSFQGSDFSYHDLDPVDFSEAYHSKIKAENEKTWILELNRKEKVDRPYGKILLTVGKDNYMPLIMEMYDDSDNLWKKMENEIKTVGKYHVIRYIKIEDKKKGSYTTLELREIKVDRGIDNTVFTQRFLKRTI
jgi:outer membrane lipoprotein-sorting protein